jgi:hypothetical protein
MERHGSALSRTRYASVCLLYYLLYYIYYRKTWKRSQPNEVRQCLWVSFALDAGLFCPIHRSLLPYTQASFALHAGLFCPIHRSLLPYTQASFAPDVGLFCPRRRSLSTQTRSSCGPQNCTKSSQMPFFFY